VSRPLETQQADAEGRLQSLTAEFSRVIAHARAAGADLDDVHITMAVALGRTTAALADPAEARVWMVDFSSLALRAYANERAKMERAEAVVYRGGDARRRRGRR
jgi:hypothetical protein